MKEFLTSPISKNTSRIALLIFILMATTMCVYRLKTYTYVTVVFNEARPVRNKIPVYYKGYKIGKVKSIKPSNDFRTTNVTLILYPRNLDLPANTTALLTREKHDRHEVDFMNLIYPEEPSETSLKSGDTINGFTTVDIDNFFSRKAITGELDAMAKNVNELLSSLKTTSDALSELMVILQDLVNENRPSIMLMTGNLAQMSDALKEFANKLNNGVDEEKLKNTLSNLDQTSANIVVTTKHFEGITQNLDAITGGVNKQVPQITTSITNADKIARNIEIITTGLRNTMSKNFAGLRLIFGRPIKPVNCQKPCK